jgi:hypothetical protein
VRAPTGSPGLLRVESTGLVRAAFTDDPLARFALASSGSASATLPWALVTGAVSRCRPPGGRLRACGRLPSGGRRHGEQHSRGSQTERFRNGRIGMAMISSVVSLPRGGKACALSTSPKVVSHRILSKEPWAVSGRPSATRLREAGRRVPRGTERADRAQSSWQLTFSRRALEYAGEGSSKRTRQAFHVEPDGIGRGYPQTGSTG